MSGWRDRLPPRREGLRWFVAAALLLIAPKLVTAWYPGRLSMMPEAGLMIALLYGVTRRSEKRRWVPWAFSLVWTALLVFEVALACGHYATNEDIPMYDEVLLARHLYILGRDLYGRLATAALVAIFVAPIPILALGAALFAQVERAFRSVPPRVGVGLAALPLIVGAIWGLLPDEHFAVPTLIANGRESWGLYSAVESQFESRSHKELDGIRLSSKPDVIVYVIESYGRVVETDPDYRAAWAPEVDKIGAQLTEAGWYTASGWDTSTVHGGRSWIADLSFMAGLHLNHEAEFEHVIALARRIPTLRKFLDEQGYTTILVKPTDRERPGVPIENSYAFDRTVFYKELGYTGPIVGWGQIPDQYTIDWVQENVLDPIPGPRFAYFHLATAHLPWTPVPDIVPDYHSLQEMEGSRKPMFSTRTADGQLAMELSRYKRTDAEAGHPVLKKEGQHENYLTDVLYDLEVIERRLADGPERPTLVIVLGDHQPPLLADGQNDDVPMHLIASDPSLLAGFRELGFQEGLRPTAEKASVKHEDLFDTIAKDLARADISGSAGSNPAEGADGAGRGQ